MRFFELDAFFGDGSVRTRFDKPWTLELGYDDGDLGGIDEASLHCEYLDESDGQWKPVQSAVDAANNKVVCSADHFTHFALVGSQQVEVKFSVFLPVVVR